MPFHELWRARIYHLEPREHVLRPMPMAYYPDHGICPRCDQLVELDLAGMVREHEVGLDGWRRKCRGSEGRPGPVQ